MIDSIQHLSEARVFQLTSHHVYGIQYTLILRQLQNRLTSLFSYNIKILPIYCLSILHTVNITYCFSIYYYYPAGNYIFRVNNRNTRTRCETCSKLTIKTPERRKWRRSGVFIVNFEHISHLNFEHAIAGWLMNVMMNQWIFRPILNYISIHFIVIICAAWKVSIFGVVLVRIFTHLDWYWEIRSISPYSIWICENRDQNNSEYGHFLRSAAYYSESRFPKSNWEFYTNPSLLEWGLFPWYITKCYRLSNLVAYL